MPKINVYNQDGKKLEAIGLEPKIFGIEPNKQLLAQYVHVYRSNQRQGTASTKTRGEVSGGGRKPWRQKGTGRARHGSTRSPIWRHGGVTFGPKPKDWSKKMPKKMKRLALFSALSQKVRDKRLIVLDKLEVKDLKTKNTAQILSKLSKAGLIIDPQKILLVLAQKERDLYRAFRNLSEMTCLELENLNAYQVLNHRNVMLLKDSLEDISKRFLKNVDNESKIKIRNVVISNT